MFRMEHTKLENVFESIYRPISFKRTKTIQSFVPPSYHLSPALELYRAGPSFRSAPPRACSSPRPLLYSSLDHSPSFSSSSARMSSVSSSLSPCVPVAICMVLMKSQRSNCIFNDSIHQLTTWWHYYYCNIWNSWVCVCTACKLYDLQ
jgi:hypothetical protein